MTKHDTASNAPTSVTALRFADGTPVPDDEVHYMPDVEARYRDFQSC